MGVEPTSPAWKAGVIAVIRQPQNSAASFSCEHTLAAIFHAILPNNSKIKGLCQEGQQLPEFHSVLVDYGTLWMLNLTHKILTTIPCKQEVCTIYQALSKQFLHPGVHHLERV